MVSTIITSKPPSIKRFGGFHIGFYQLVKGDIARAGIVNIRGQGSGSAGRPENTGDKRGRSGVENSSAALRASWAETTLISARNASISIISLGDGGRVKGVGLNNIRTGIKVGAVDITDNIRLSQA